MVEGKKREEEMQSKYDATKAEVAEAMAALEKAKQQASWRWVWGVGGGG